MAWAITAAVVMSATTAMSINQQNKAAEDAQNAAVARQNLMNKQQEQQMQEVQAEAGAALTNEARERLRERGKIQAASAESGVAGASPLRELANTYVQEAFNTGTIISKEEAALRSTAMQSQQTQLETQSAINQAESSKTTGLAAALQIGVAGLQGYGMAGGFSAAAPAATTTGVTTTSTAASSTPFTDMYFKPIVL